ncbi:MAG: DNA polymerase IV [Ignavibacteria bacterium]
MARITTDRNTIEKREDSWVLFVDMNSFFATVEQQYNFWLRRRPIGVCVYTGKFGCIIAPSIEAKARGIKVGMRLNEAMKICPDLIPVETKPERYREIHKKFIKVLEKYSEEVLPKSIDEAVVDITNYKLFHKDPILVAKKIKEDIRNEVGDYITCSIGIAPNAFLAKFAANLKKPDGLTQITNETIDDVLKTVKLTDLPGIKEGIARRLISAGIRTPVDLRHSSPSKLKNACSSIIGVYWYYRLNFSEVDQISSRYKSMQAMRQVSREQRKSLDTLNHIFLRICLTLEKRMVKEGVFCNEISFFSSYEDGYNWKDHVVTKKPLQDGVEIMNLIKLHMNSFQAIKKCEPIINENLRSIGVAVDRFVPADTVQYELFSKDVTKDNLRKIVYDIKDRFGSDIIMRAIELKDENVLKDVIGFGSVKDLHPEEEVSV